MREPTQKRIQTFDRPKTLSRPDFRLSFVKYEASLQPNNIQSPTTIGRPPSQPHPTVKNSPCRAWRLSRSLVGKKTSRVRAAQVAKSWHGSPVHSHGPDLGELEGGHDVPELWPPMFAGL